jgi:hypothetical protein
VTVNKNAGTGIVGVDTENVKTFDQVLISNDVIVFGYPASLGMQSPSQTQLDLR